MKTTLVVALVLLAGLCTASQYRNRRLNDNDQDSPQRDQQQRKAKPFRAGYEYVFSYNGQIASGLDVNGPSTEEPQQKAVSQLKAQAKITFESDQRATLRLESIALGQLNQPIESPQKVHPFGKFEKKQLDEKKQNKLELPLMFTYNDGVVEEIQFHADDSTWSKNIKRGVLNLIQLNLKRRSVPGDDQQQQQQQMDSAEERYSQMEEENQSPFKTFTQPEITVEGQCQTTYTITKNKRLQQTGQQDDSTEQRDQWNDQQQQQQQQKSFNVTKTIDFKQCSQIADVAFGYQTQQLQSQCNKCKSPQLSSQQQQTYGPQQQQQQQCHEECDPKEVKDQKLDRTTAIRFVLTGQSPQQNYGIQRVELVSQYIYKNLRAENSQSNPSVMQTVVAAQLVFRYSQEKQGQQQQKSFRAEQQQQNQQGEQQRLQNTLLYDNEQEVQEKRWYMVGDDEFHQQQEQPFAHVRNKLDQAQQVLRNLIKTTVDKLNGIEYTESSKLQRLVEILRMCSVQELEKLYQQMTADRSQSEEQAAQQILADALAIAGTRNTIKVLAQKITNQLQPDTAAQALKQLSGLPAPSDKQAEIVKNLCQSTKVQDHQNLKEACWLTFGSVVNEVCQHRVQKGDKNVPIFGAQTGYASFQQCNPTKKESYQKVLLSQFKNAKGPYQKILALKAIGNAGLTTSVQPLEKIINDRSQGPIVRGNAIDALRRLRLQMPRKIQRVLLPIMQNSHEHPCVRMTAFGMIMQTNPDQPIIDQVTYTLSKERNPQVQALVFAALKSLSKTNIPSQQRMAKHLQNTLKLENVDWQQLQGSQVYQIPIYSDEQKEGANLNLVSVFFNRNGVVPNHMAVALNTMLNGEFEQDSLRVGLTQQNAEQWYEGLVKTVLQQGQSSNYQKTRGERSSSPNPRHQEKLRQYIKGLQVKTRRSAYQQRQQDSQEELSNEQQQGQPIVFLTIRNGDVDTSIVSMTRQTLPRCVKSVAEGQRLSLADCLSHIETTKHFRAVKAMCLNEKSAKIPTSMGVPLQILQATPVLAICEGQIQANQDGKIQFDVHPSACATNIQKMEAWSAAIATGVQSSQAIEMNIPIVGDIQVSAQSLKMSVKTPPAQTRLLGLHTLPTTYTRDYDTKQHQLREPKMKAIHFPQLEQFQRDVNKVVGQHSTGLPILIQGHIHQPSNPTDYKQLVQLAMCTENHMHAKFQQDESPREIVFRIDISAFSKQETSQGPKLDNFYSKSSNFGSDSDNDDEEQDRFQDMDNHSQRSSKLNGFLNNFRGSIYKHQLKLSVETKGGRKQAKAEVTGTATCDASLKFCRMGLDAIRTPMLAKENTDWQLQSQVQILMPEPVSNVQQLQQGYSSNDQNKNRKLIVKGNAEWGCQKKQWIDFQVEGEKAHTKQWQQHISSQFQGPQQQFQQKKAAFLNKYKLVAEYDLQPQSENVFERSLEMLKSCAGFWNTDIQLREDRDQQQLQRQPKNSRSGKVICSVVIDPITLQHANVTVKTPNEIVRIQSMEMPMKIRPFPLVRPAQKSVHSAKQLFRRLAESQGRAECSVDGQRVSTFDDVLYRAPIGKCYSVLAKDCSSDDQPQFAVMMKTLANGQDKKIKVVTPEQMIECQPSTKDSDSQQKKLRCKVNGQTISSQDQDQDEEQDNQTVEYNNDDQTDVTITVEGVQVRFGCWGSQGCKKQKAWIKLSSDYKEGQCGLCGHYDDQADNDLRMANNERANDLQQFHRSYSLRNNNNDQDEQCDNEELNNFYSSNNKRRFRQMNYGDEDDSQQTDNDEQDQWQQKKGKRTNDWSSQQDDEQDQDQWQAADQEDQWQAGAYHNDDSSEEDQWGRQGSKSKQWKMKQGRRRMVQQKNRRSGQQQQQQGVSDYEQQGEEPIESTKVLEYNHKVCFSVQKVMQCPPGSFPVNDNASDEQDSNGQNDKKIKFACIDRSDPEARRMQRQARQGVPVDTGRLQPSFVENVREPQRCTVY